MKKRLTKSKIDHLRRPAAGKRLTVYDAGEKSPSGFGLRKFASGKVSFFLEYGQAHKRQRVTIGTYGDWTLDEAQKRARELKVEVDKGTDPVEERRKERKVPTFKAWVDTYLGRVEKRKKTHRQDKYHLWGHDGGRSKDAEPVESETMQRWGSRRLDNINAGDVEALMGWTQERAAASACGGTGHTAANRWLASVRACFAAAIRDDLITKNPAADVRLYREGAPRQRVLTDDEMGRLRDAVAKLKDEENAMMVVLLDTGCRVSEVLKMQWSDLDLSNRVWTVPSPKAGRPQAMPLALTVVHALEEIGQRSRWAFPGVDPDRPRTTVRGLWRRLKEAAEIPADVHVHDIRRTFGLRVARTAGIHAASKLLRHSSIVVTSKVYVPLGVDELRSVVDEVSRPDNVVPIKAKR